MREAIRAHQRSSEVISGHQRSSAEAHQRSSVLREGLAVHRADEVVAQPETLEMRRPPDEDSNQWPSSGAIKHHQADRDLEMRRPRVRIVRAQSA